MVRPAPIEGNCARTIPLRRTCKSGGGRFTVYRKLVEHALEGNPYSLMFAKSGREALELFARHLPAIVITDWMMPDFSGLDLCQQLRADIHRGYTYIIMLTSIAEKGNVVKGLAAGADDYLTKPFDPGELLARIGVGRRIIDLHRQIDAKNKLLEEMAHSDSLTGLPNRRAVEEWAARQLRAAARHGFPYWVVLTDWIHSRPLTIRTATMAAMPCCKIRRHSENGCSRL